MSPEKESGDVNGVEHDGTDAEDAVLVPPKRKAAPTDTDAANPSKKQRLEKFTGPVKQNNGPKSRHAQAKNYTPSTHADEPNPNPELQTALAKVAELEQTVATLKQDAARTASARKMFQGLDKECDNFTNILRTSKETHELEMAAEKKASKTRESRFKEMLASRDRALASRKQQFETFMGVNSWTVVLPREGDKKYPPTYGSEDIRKRWYFRWDDLRMIAPSEREYPDQKKLAECDLDATFRDLMKRVGGGPAPQKKTHTSSRDTSRD
jgi:hypothetical protein